MFVNEIFFLDFLFRSVIFAVRKYYCLCMLVLCPASLSNSFVTCHSFLVASVSLSMYEVMLPRWIFCFSSFQF